MQAVPRKCGELCPCNVIHVVATDYLQQCIRSGSVDHIEMVIMPSCMIYEMNTYGIPVKTILKMDENWPRYQWVRSDKFQHVKHSIASQCEHFEHCIVSCNHKYTTRKVYTGLYDYKY